MRGNVVKGCSVEQTGRQGDHGVRYDIHKQTDRVIWLDLMHTYHEL